MLTQSLTHLSCSTTRVSRTTTIQKPGGARRKMGGPREAPRTAAARRERLEAELLERRPKQEVSCAPEVDVVERDWRAGRLEIAGVQRNPPPLVRVPDAMSSPEVSSYIGTHPYSMHILGIVLPSCTCHQFLNSRERTKASQTIHSSNG